MRIASFVPFPMIRYGLARTRELREKAPTIGDKLPPLLEQWARTHLLLRLVQAVVWPIIIPLYGLHLVFAALDGFMLTLGRPLRSIEEWAEEGAQEKAWRYNSVAGINRITSRKA